MRSLALAVLALGSALALAPTVGCAVEPATDELDGPLDTVPDALSENARGPRVSDGSSTEVWAVTNAWTDTSTTEAKKAGVAWGASSGLTWEEKYAAWVGAMKRVPAASWGDTIEIATPYGTRALPGPALECAEVAMLLRLTFASWYHLPLFLTGWNAKAKAPLFAGHMGFVGSDGRGAAGFPSFKVAYKDYEKTWKDGAPWPTDAKLRTMHLGSDDANSFLGDGAGAGAYFDELFLNKRVGYLARLLLLYFGSVNLADDANTMHIVPEATSAGDVLLERWQKKGIGHTIPVIRVESTGGEHLAIDVASGSMPRRQPRWDGPEQSKWSFTNPMTGGKGQDGEGNPYAKLGGGIRRFRTAAKAGGRWLNVVSAADAKVRILPTDLARIEARPERFAVILAEGSPEEQRDAALARIADARRHLREHPASCSARTTREDAFAKLYDLSRDHFAMDAAAVDAKWRTLEDYAFAELQYEKSKTCCWNTTTTAMGELILAFAKKEQDDAAAQKKCVQPTVFAASGAGGSSDGYAAFRAFAKAQGREADWRAWSEDEPCAQRAVTDDVLGPRGNRAFCK
jgi:hypothetical protein